MSVVHTSTPDGRRGRLDSALSFVRRQPLSIVVAIVAGFAPGPWPERVIGIVAALVLVGAAERRLRFGQVLIATVAGALVAAAAAALTARLATGIGTSWALDLASHATLAPITPSLAAIMAASAVVGPLWRRRIRLLGFAAILALVLYDGRSASVFALIGALTGLAIGPAFRGRRRARAIWAQSSRHEARVLLSGLVAITAVGPLITLSTRAPAGLLAPLGHLFQDHYTVSRTVMHRCAALARLSVGPVGDRTACLRDSAIIGLHGPGTILLSVLPLVTLLIAAGLIRRGSRLAVIVAVGVDLLLGILAAVYYAVLPLTVDDETGVREERFRVLLVHSVSIVTPIGVGVVLLMFLRHFAVRAPRRAALGFAVVVAGSFIVLLIVYIGVSAVDLGAFRPATSLGQLVLLAPQRFVPLGFLGPVHLGPVPAGGAARIVFETVGAAFWLVSAAGLAVAGRQAIPAVATDRSRADVRRILRRGVSGAMSHMATWADNSYWFSTDRTRAVAYRRVGAVAITLGDPLCRRDERARTIGEFARWCDASGVTPVFYSVEADLDPVFRDLGWSTMPVAEETVIRPQTFSMRGKKWQDIRSSINRAAANDVRAEWTRYGDLRPGVTRQIHDISEEWVADKSLPEMGFTLGGVDEMIDPDVRLMIAIDGTGRVLAVTSWLPSWRDDTVIGWTLDFMRRRRDSMNGVMEFLIAEVALRAQTEGTEFVSLSAAPLATQAGPADELSQTERLLSTLSRTLEPAYGFRSLLAFKLKFQPDLEPLVMAYPDPLQLPLIGTALARAYMPSLSPRRIPSILRNGR
jgi:lysylphosphatidylglycerol synthetase-like protein (DUF2156 family)